MSHLNTAYQIGSHDAYVAFTKQAEGENLGDPNFWSGGTPSPEEDMAAQQPANAEETINLLPAGTFQGLQTKITPDGAKTVSVKVTPDALQTPDALNAFFQTGENAKIEITSPDLAASETGYNESAGSDIPLPGEQVPAQPGGMAPAPGPVTGGGV